nr:Gfo/Idh/MocA family oxidoreductase [Clostridiales bacterium]
MGKIKLGIFGLRRGADYLDAIRLNGFEVTVVCDSDASRYEAAKDRLPGAVFYTDPDEFAWHPMDAVFLANFFHEHAPWAVRFLEKGVHVLSECASNGTMAQGV